MADNLSNTEGVYAHAGDVIVRPGRRLTRAQAISIAAWLLVTAEEALEQGVALELDDFDEEGTDAKFSRVFQAIEARALPSEGSERLLGPEPPPPPPPPPPPEG